MPESLRDLVQRLRSEGTIIGPWQRTPDCPCEPDDCECGPSEIKDYVSNLEACIEKGSVLAPQEGVQG